MGRSILRVSVWRAVALLGAMGLATVALHRAESINAIWIVMAGPCTYALGFSFYSKFIAPKALALELGGEPPAEFFDDGCDFTPSNKWIILGRHFAAIAGPRPLGGPGGHIG
jgi:carbon starvation protein